MKLIRYELPTHPTATDLDRWFDATFRELARWPGIGDGFRPSNAVPVVDVEEAEDAWTYRFEIPGVKREDLKVELENAVLTVEGRVRSRRGESADTETHVSRSLTVPDGVRADAIEARLDDGILTVRLPKEEERKPRLITVQ